MFIFCPLIFSLLTLGFKSCEIVIKYLISLFIQFSDSNWEETARKVKEEARSYQVSLILDLFYLIILVIIIIIIISTTYVPARIPWNLLFLRQGAQRAPSLL